MIYDDKYWNTIGERARQLKLPVGKIACPYCSSIQIGTLEPICPFCNKLLWKLEDILQPEFSKILNND